MDGLISSDYTIITICITLICINDFKKNKCYKFKVK